MANYIGKVAAVVTANVSDVAPKLNASAREWDRYGKSVQGTLDAARRNAKSAFDQIFTGQQRLERAFAAARNSTLQINTREGEAAIRRLVQASDEIARPLASAQKQYSSLSATIQGEFARAFSEATNAARTAQSTINETGRLGEQAFERYKRRVDEAVVSIRRLTEANAAATGLATGRELRFQQAGFAAELQRASAVQTQASALPANARSSGAIGQLVELQRREAEEAARLLSVLENIRNTRRGDAASAQANLDAQAQRLAQVNSQLERQIVLYGEVTQRQRQVAAAAEQVAARRSATELNRRSGVLAQRNDAAFVAATADLVTDPDISRRQAELDRSDRLKQEFGRLPADVQSSLERERERFLNTAAAAKAGAAGVGTLADANDRLAASIARVVEEEADRQRRREVATSLLPPVIDPPPDPRDISLERTQELGNRLGPDIASSAAALGGLESSTISLKGQIAQLPAPLRAQLIPAIRQAENELLRLTAADDALPDDIERAAAQLRALTQNVSSAQRAAATFGNTFREFADQGSIQAAAGGLQFLREQLRRGRGDTSLAEEALDDYAAALQRAASVPGGFRQFSGQLAVIRQSAVQAVAGVQGVGLSSARLNEGLARAGDVARGAFGSSGLALQQFVFAVDDFFSVTGDLSQRIRAAGNNISQLGFILGGTQGLIAGVAAALVGQGVAALIRWANSGVEATNKTKSLNDALQRQKSIVDELAQSLRQLSDSFTLDAFQGGARNAEQFRREIEALRRQQAEARRESLLALDPDVQRERAIQDARRAELEREPDIGRRVAIQRELQLSQARERAAANRAAAQQSPAPQQAVEAVIRQIDDQFQARAEDLARSFGADIPEQAAADLRAAQRELAGRAQADVRQRLPAADIEQARALVQQRIDELTETRRTVAGTVEEFEISRQLTELQTLSLLLSKAAQEAIDNQSLAIVASLRAAQLGLESAFQSVSDAIQQGIPGAVLFQQEVTAAAQALSTARTAFDEATAALRDAEDLPQGGQRDAAVQQARRARDAAERGVAAAQRRSEALERRAAGVRAELFIDPQQTFDARVSRASDSLQQAQLASGRIARRLRVREFDRDERIREINDPRTTDARRRQLSDELERGNLFIKALEAAALAAERLGESLNRASQDIASDLSTAQGSADQARRRDLGFSTAQSMRELEARRADLADQRDIERRGQAAIEVERARLEERVLLRGEAIGIFDPFQQIRDINETLSSGDIDSGERAELLRQRARLQASIQDLVDEFDSAAQAISDVSARRREVAELAAEGRELALTPAQRAGETLARQLEALRVSFALQAEETTGLIDQAGLREAQGRVFNDQIRQQAPLLAQFSDEVANAVLQGPSRAALQVSDASTVEGQRELNRLLRGDDPARDVNLIELQRQTAAVEELVRIARENGVVIANN